ncbi:hypothetical protein ANO11243_005120 [Dothideomycetidae sp. 11243]|nr:hypothetical protein ANO11243_005120 [fungal sp. No.11243]
MRAGIRMLELYHRFLHANVTFHGDLAFVNTWNFFMPDPGARLDNLVPVGPYAGTLEAFHTGIKLRTRYESLVEEAVALGQTNLWASGSKRVEETAKYFAAGLYGLNWTNIATLHVIPETMDLGADTLTPGDTCTAYRDNIDDFGHDYGYHKLNEWKATYLPPIASRLATLAPEISFTIHEIYTMQEMCGFETLARGNSPWCDLFTRSEWEHFEYARDLLHFYRAGAGNRYGPTMGWLYLNATTELLMSDPEDVGRLFFSFAHDGDIVPFLAALALLPQLKPLPADRELKDRVWRTSEVVPMGGRVILERIACPAPRSCWSNEPFYPNHVYCDPERDDYYVRINVNDGIVPLEDCDDGPGRSCPLHRFGEHVERRGRHVDDFRELCKLDDSAPSRITFLKQPLHKAHDITA